MVKKEVIDGLVSKWIGIAERDLLTAKQGLEAEIVITDTVSFHCQQAAEKYLKAFLVKHQIEFTKTHSIIALLNLCSTVDKSFNEELTEVDYLTDYAVEIRYP
ncbi:MAG: HEPN domain-containing protein, partial [Deltaproteobacteria bacterium]|nr:HEPN domain-containing protein [Deltaproteobacteria bacterium]